jgi:hypothetical protein
MIIVPSIHTAVTSTAEELRSLSSGLVMSIDGTMIIDVDSAWSLEESEQFISSIEEGLNKILSRNSVGPCRGGSRYSKYGVYVSTG